MQIPVVIISLPSDHVRRDRISASLEAAGVSFRFSDGIDGRALSTAEREAAAPPGSRWFDRTLLPAEIGCSLSHLAAMEAAISEPADFVCILEDDAEPLPGLRDALDSDALAALPYFDVLKLYVDDDRLRRPAWAIARLTDRRVYAVARPSLSAIGQIYRRERLAAIIAALRPLRAPFDFALFHDCHVRGLTVLELRSNVVIKGKDALDSRIGDREGLPSVNRRFWRWFRKLRAMLSFAQAWGLRGYPILLQKPPYFR